MRRVIAVAVASMVAGLPLVLYPSAAQALQAPVAFTAEALPTYQTNGVAWTVATAGNLTFVGGTFTTVRPPGAAEGTSEVVRSNFVVLNAATGAPTSCAPTFTLPSNPAQATVRALNVSPDGKTLYIGGQFSNVQGAAQAQLAALDIASCTVVSSFKPQPSGVVRSIASTASTVYVGGTLGAIGGQARRGAGAVSAVGTSAPGALQTWAPAFDKDVRAVALSPDRSKVVVGGDFFTTNGADSHALAVVDAVSGAVTTAYPLGFIERNSVVKDVAVDETGFYTGNEGTGGGVFDGRIALNWSDYGQRWRDECLGATQSLVSYKGVVYSASHAHDCHFNGGYPDGARHHLLAQSTNDPTLLSWFPDTNDGIGEGIGPRDMAVAKQATGDLMYVVGEFTTVNGVAQRGITRFGGTPDRTAPSSPTTVVTSPGAGQARVAWRRSVDLDDAALTYSVYRDGSSTPLYSAVGSSFFWVRQQMSFLDTTVSPGSTHSYRVGVSDGTNSTLGAARSIKVANARTSPYGDRVVADGATLLWQYNETGDVFISDSSTNDQNGTLRGGATYQVQPSAVPAEAGRAITLAGATSSIATETRFLQPADFTVETWFKTTSTAGGKLIGFGDKQSGNSSNYDKHVYMTNDGRLVFGTYNNGIRAITSSAAYNDGLWHHVAASQSGSGMGLYVDGARVARNTAVGSQPYSGYWRVGGDNLGGWPDRPSSDYLAASFDETAVYASALTANTIRDHVTLAGGTVPPGYVPPSDFYGQTVTQDGPQLYWRLGEPSGSIAADASGNDTPGTYSTGVTYGAPGAVAATNNTAVALDGSSENPLVSSEPIVPNAYTEEAWFKTSTLRGGKILGFGGSATGNSGSYDKHVYMTNDGRLVFGVYTGDIVTVSTSATYNDGAYHHVVASQGPAGMALYVDGVLVGSNSETRNQGFTGYFRVGADNLNAWVDQPTSSSFAGVVDEVALYPGVLSASRVSAHYAAGSPPKADATSPTSPSGVTGGMSAGDVLLAWNPSTDDVSVAAYDVHRSTSPGFVPSAANRIGSTSTTNFTDSAVGVGTFSYVVVARDGAGNASQPSTEVTVAIADTTAPSTPGSPGVNTTSSSAAVSWTSSTDNVGVTEYEIYRATSPGAPADDAHLIATTTETDYLDEGLAQGTYYYRVVAKDAAGNLSAPTSDLKAVVADRTPPTSPSGVAVSVVNGTATITWSAATDDVAVVGYDVYRSGTAGAASSPGTRIGSTAGTTYSQGPLSPGTYYYRVVAKDAAGNVSADSAEVAAAVGDGAAPTVPAGVSARATGSSVTVTWTASSDDVAVEGYDVYRSSTAGAAPAPATLVGQVSGSNFTETGLASGSYFYRVVARDTAGNRSAPSNEAAVTISGATSVVTLTPVADTWANQGAPNTNLGTDASLSSRGTTGAVAYLRYALPAAPPGMTLRTATFGYRTTTLSTAGSADAHVVRQAGDTWNEAALTWNNRPALVGPALGNLSGATSTNTAYSAPLDAAALAPLLGASTTLAISSTGTDSLYLWSSNYGRAADRPQLVLTFG